MYNLSLAECDSSVASSELKGANKFATLQEVMLWSGVVTLEVTMTDDENTATVRIGRR